MEEIKFFGAFLLQLANDFVSCAAGGCTAKMCRDESFYPGAAFETEEAWAEHARTDHSWNRRVQRRHLHIVR